MKKSTLLFISSLFFTACLIYLGSQIGKYYFACDDAFVSFRYAKNLFEGNGLAFNLGERVEGFSNFAWVLLASLSFLFKVSPDTWANSLSILATVLMLWGLWSCVKSKHDLSSALLIFGVALMYLSLNRSFAVWATSGLETRLFSLLIFLAITFSPIFRSSNQRLLLSSSLFTLAALTRMEAYLFYGVVSLMILLVMRVHRQWSRKDFIRWFAPFLAVATSHLIFRLIYFGDPLPNTFYAKVGQPQFSWGGKYLLAFVLEYQVWLLAPLLALGLVGSDEISRGLRRTALIFVPYIGWLTYIGGDHFEFRMLDLLLPFLALMLGVAVWKLMKLKASWLARTGLVSGAIVIVVFTTFVIAWTGEKAIDEKYQVAVTPRVNFTRFSTLRLIPGFRPYCDYYHSLNSHLTRCLICVRAEEHRLFAEKVKRQADLLNDYISEGIIPENPTLCLMCAGIIPFYTDLTTIDYHGLTDRHIARQEDSDNPVVSRALLAHMKNADSQYLRSRGVDYISSIGFGFFTSKNPAVLAQPNTYMIKLPDNYFAFQTTLSINEVIRRFKHYRIMYRDFDNSLRRVN